MSQRPSRNNPKLTPKGLEPSNLMVELPLTADGRVETTPVSKPTLCVDCFHFRFNLEMAKIHMLPLCSATRANYLSNGMLSWAPAASVNTEGRCPKFLSNEHKRPGFWDEL